MDVTPETQHRPGQPRSERDAALLERFDARMQLPIVAAVAIMITGIAVLGVLAGSLASFFRLDDGNGAGSPPGKPADAAATGNDAALAALTTEVSALRRQVEALTRQLTGAPADLTSEEPAPREDTADTRLPMCRCRGYG